MLNIIKNLFKKGDSKIIALEQEINALYQANHKLMEELSFALGGDVIEAVKQENKSEKMTTDLGIDYLKKTLKSIPEGASGYGAIQVEKNGVAETLEFRSKKELESIIADLKSGKLKFVMPNTGLQTYGN
jgi:hypothetical protein